MMPWAVLLLFFFFFFFICKGILKWLLVKCSQLLSFACLFGQPVKGPLKYSTAILLVLGRNSCKSIERELYLLSQVPDVLACTCASRNQRLINFEPCKRWFLFIAILQSHTADDAVSRCFYLQQHACVQMCTPLERYTEHYRLLRHHVGLGESPVDVQKLKRLILVIQARFHFRMARIAK